MPVIEIIGIVVVGIVSVLDLIVNIFTLCCSGRSNIQCCKCFVFTHASEEVVVSDNRRRESVAREIKSDNENETGNGFED